MPGEQACELTCPAKLNLALSVGAVNDDGLHPIASWMVALAFGDVLRLSLPDDGRTRFDIAFKNDPVGARVNWPLEDDLAFRARSLLSDRTGSDLPVVAQIRKRIPPGSGLGGGSSNAAAMLVGLNRLHGTRIDPEDLVALSSELGSDVAFLTRAVLGAAAAVVTDVGQTVHPLPAREPIHLVLIFPPFACSTKSVYEAFDVIHERAEVDEARVRALAAKPALDPTDPFNDLGPAAEQVEARLAAMRRRLEADLDHPVHVSGSGSTLYLVAAPGSAATNLARRVQATGHAAIVTRTI